jgi:hypothetical protein
MSLFLLNWIALISNVRVISHLRPLTKQPEAFGLPPISQPTGHVPVGWYRDPRERPDSAIGMTPRGPNEPNGRHERNGLIAENSDDYVGVILTVDLFRRRP